MKTSRTIVAAIVGLLLVSACGGRPTMAPGTQAGSNVIEVRLTDEFRIEPDPIVVPAGAPVTFRITNTGATLHEFYVGDEAAQAEHEEQMAGHGMAHDDPNGVEVAPGTTGELTMTFDSPGQTLAGCHIPGHYPAGMKAVITIGS